MYIYTHVYLYICIYIYIYTYRHVLYIYMVVSQSGGHPNHRLFFSASTSKCPLAQARISGVLGRHVVALLRIKVSCFQIMNHWCYTQLTYIYIWYIWYIYIYIYIPLSGDIPNNITGVLYNYYKFLVGGFKPSWKIWKWLIPLSKWVITPVINGISRVNPLITGVITHLLSGMSHQVVILHFI